MQQLIERTKLDENVAFHLRFLRCRFIGRVLFPVNIKLRYDESQYALVRVNALPFAAKTGGIHLEHLNL
jgi:hypothetical protein